MAFFWQNPAKSLQPNPRTLYRAYDKVTEWSGQVHHSVWRAQQDADRHNRGMRKQGGYGSAFVVQPHPEAEGRLADLQGTTVWPPHGRGSGAARWI